MRIETVLKWMDGVQNKAVDVENAMETKLPKDTLDKINDLAILAEEISMEISETIDGPDEDEEGDEDN